MLKKQPHIGSFIREVRQKTRLTQEQFAAKLGVVFSTLNRWENGRTIPSPLAMQKILQYAQQMGESGQDLLALLDVE
jgi:putative transcriptional regulator